MKGSISLEFIGASTADMLRQFEKLESRFGFGGDDDTPRHPFDRSGPCVLRVHRSESGKVCGEQVWGKRDYSKANSKGTRGVYVHYVLEENELYWIKAPQSWRSTSIYFAAVTPVGDIKRLTDEEAEEWLSAL